VTGPSLRGQLLRWLIIPLGVLGLVDAWHNSATVERAVNAAFDRSLHGSALAISDHVMLRAGQPVVDLPSVALEMLATGEQERIFYRVSYQAPGQGDTFLSGYSDLPVASASLGTAVFYDGRYRDDDVRIVALRSQIPQDARMTVQVLVAETLRARTATTRSIVARSLASELVLILLPAVLVWLVVTRGLRPLRLLSNEVAHRSATQLTPLQQERVPREVRPLVEAMNGLMEHVREAMEARQRFIADASHQLRTPLAVLRAEADAALRKDDLPSMRAAIELLRDHSQAAGHLAAQLLSLARAEPGTEPPGSEPVIDLTAVARDACAALVPAALAQDVDLGFEGSVPVAIRGHRVLLTELIANLVSNAVQYGGRHGHVTVRVTGGDGSAPCLAVEDDGPGIPAEEHQRVFERFYRIPGTPGHGAGLGLAIVQQIAIRHGAGVSLRDGPGGRGLTVEIRFPCLDPA
jgi:two-component system, OmpR family, sensor histidine kinase TctE